MRANRTLLFYQVGKDVRHPVSNDGRVNCCRDLILIKHRPKGTHRPEIGATPFPLFSEYTKKTLLFHR